MKTIASTGMIVVAIGMEAKYQWMGFLMSRSWFVTVWTVLLVALTLVFVVVSYSRAIEKRKLDVNARQLFAASIPRLDPGERDFQIMLSMAGTRHLSSSDVFTVESDEKNKIPLSKWYRLLRKNNRREKGRRMSHDQVINDRR